MGFEDRKQPQYRNRGRIHPRRSKPYNFAGPSHSKASVSGGEGKEFKINEGISSVRDKQNNAHRTSSFPKSASQLVERYDVRRKSGHLNGESLFKTPGTDKVAARTEVNATAPNGTGTAKRRGLRFGSSEYSLRHQLANSQSSNVYIQCQGTRGLTRTSTRIAETSHTEFKPIDHKIYSTTDLDALVNKTVNTNDLFRDVEPFVTSMAVIDAQSTNNTQKNDNAVTQDERLRDKSLKLSPPSRIADDNSFVDQHYDMRNYMQLSDPHKHPHLDLMQQIQASSAPTGHPISFHHSGNTQLRQGYQASLSNIRAVQDYGRRGVPVGNRKDKTFEKLSNASSASGHYTISQDHTAGEETRRSHLLANFGRRCGASMNERKQLEVTNGELDTPAISIEFESAWNKVIAIYHEEQKKTIAPADI